MLSNIRFQQRGPVVGYLDADADPFTDELAVRLAQSLTLIYGLSADVMQATGANMPSIHAV